MDPQRIEYDLNQEDMSAFVGWQRFDSASARRQWRNFRVFAFGLSALGFAIAIVSRDLYLFAMMMFSGTLLCGFAVIYPSKLLRRRNVAVNLKQLAVDPTSARLFTKHVLVFTEEGVQHTCGAASSFTPWTHVLRLDRSNGHAFVYLNPQLAILVPRRALAHDSAFDAFCEISQDRIVRARTSSEKRTRPDD